MARSGVLKESLKNAFNLTLQEASCENVGQKLVENVLKIFKVKAAPDDAVVNVESDSISVTFIKNLPQPYPLNSYGQEVTHQSVVLSKPEVSKALSLSAERSSSELAELFEGMPVEKLWEKLGLSNHFWTIASDTEQKAALDFLECFLVVERKERADKNALLIECLYPVEVRSEVRERPPKVGFSQEEWDELRRKWNSFLEANSKTRQFKYFVVDLKRVLNECDFFDVIFDRTYYDPQEKTFKSEKFGLASKTPFPSANAESLLVKLKVKKGLLKGKTLELGDLLRDDLDVVVALLREAVDRIDALEKKFLKEYARFEKEVGAYLSNFVTLRCLVNYVDKGERRSTECWGKLGSLEVASDLPLDLEHLTNFLVNSLAFKPFAILEKSVSVKEEKKGVPVSFDVDVYVNLYDVSGEKLADLEKTASLLNESLNREFKRTEVELKLKRELLRRERRRVESVKELPESYGTEKEQEKNRRKKIKLEDRTCFT